MSLFKFQTQVSSKDAFAIRARDLDENFSQLQPKSNGTYGLQQGVDGWSLEIYPAFPLEATAAHFLAWHTGGLQWRSAEDIAQDVTPTSTNPITAPGAVAPSALSPGPNGSLFITEANEAQWSDAPPSGTPGWVEVERCDGQRMYVWGTEWAAPA
jgi:hypothetical protein